MYLVGVLFWEHFIAQPNAEVLSSESLAHSELAQSVRDLCEGCLAFEVPRGSVGCIRCGCVSTILDLKSPKRGLCSA